MKNKKYLTVGPVLKYLTVGPVLKYLTVGPVLKYRTVGPVLKSKAKIVERGKFDTLSAPIYDHSFSWLGTCTLIKSGGINKNVDMTFSAHDAFLE
jgi:hypothetical protein